MKIASCIIIKNEKIHIKSLLEQLLTFSDEVVVTDTGSADGTIEILNELAEKNPKIKLTQFEWINDFSAARNFSFSNVSDADWIFWCDADDVLTEELITTIKWLGSEGIDDKYNSVIFNYEFSKDTWVPRRRLLRRTSNPLWYDRIHEYVMPRVPGEELDLSDLANGYIKHDHRNGAHTDRNLRIFIDMICKGQPMTSRNMHYYANELMDAGKVDTAYIVYDRTLDQLDGWDAWNVLNKMYWMDQSRNNLEYWLGRALHTAGRIEMRGDVCYLIGLTYLKIGNKDQGKAWLFKALDVDASGLDAYGEDIYQSKYLPAKILKDIFSEEGDEEKSTMMDELIKRFIEEYKLDTKKIESLQSSINGTT